MMKRRFLSHSPSALWRKVSGAAAMPWLSAGRRVRVSAQREAPRPELGNERASGDEAELENGRLPDNGTALKDGRKLEKDAVSGNGPELEGEPVFVNCRGA